MKYSAPAEGFRIAYDRMGSGKPVVLLHGWPGDRTDYNALAPILAQHADVIVPDLRGFGQSDKHLVEPETVYSAPGQADCGGPFRSSSFGHKWACKVFNSMRARGGSRSLLAVYIERSGST